MSAAVLASKVAEVELDTLTVIVASRALVQTAEVTCGEDPKLSISALVGAIVTIAAAYQGTDELLAIAIAGLNDARGPVSDSIRAVVLRGAGTRGTPS